ncbi:MAG: ribosome biogenesis GTP-binding protein YihA/YsxC [Acidimicrobiales bacterium]
MRFRFVMSGDDVWRLPPTRAEVAFLGRSNVGKSSLLNALANHKRLAHTSKTPGRTQLLNLFELGDGTSAVDLPGYGFAAVPGKTRSGWQAMIEGYLLERAELDMVLVLVDGEIGPTKLDVQMLDWLRAHGLPHTVVASKQDKVKPSKRGVRRREVAEGCGVAVDDVVWVSAAKGDGIVELRSLIHTWLARGMASRPPVAPDGGGPAPLTPSAGKAAKGVVVVEPGPDGTYADEDEWN